ncbi:MAG: glycosyltransferase family 4 protein [Rikenellaceae bacterium]|nr:glycosyltransferase family 4 protein [Rikenellaceae bacterium]
MLIYSSEWAAGSAVEDFGTDPTKVKVVPFGANIESKRTEADIEAFIQTRLASPTCNLLFVGVDWKRKGGAKAVAVATRLHEMGVPVRLDIVGIREPLDLPGFAVNHGFISKDTAAGCKKIDSLFAQAHFFILPTQAECFGVVFSEASSFGLPSLATDTGGVGGAVRDGINGMKFTSDANPQQWADYIAKLWQDKAAYEKLALSSFHEYETRLNWDVAGKAIMGHIREILEKRKQTR